MEAAERARLVEAHLDVVQKAAKMIYVRVKEHVELDELIAFGNTGLAEAAQRFDPTRGASFSTFAWYRVQGAIIDGLRKLTHLPRATWRKLVALRAANDSTPLDALRVPAEHLLASPIIVPPGLFAKRWLVLYTPDSRKTGCIRRMQLGYRLDDGQVEYASVTFRDPKSHSPWQFAVCFS